MKLRSFLAAVAVGNVLFTTTACEASDNPAPNPTQRPPATSTARPVPGRAMDLPLPFVDFTNPTATTTYTEIAFQGGYNKGWGIAYKFDCPEARLVPGTTGRFAIRILDATYRSTDWVTTKRDQRSDEGMARTSSELAEQSGGVSIRIFGKCRFTIDLAPGSLPQGRSSGVTVTVPMEPNQFVWSRSSQGTGQRDHVLVDPTLRVNQVTVHWRYDCGGRKASFKLESPASAPSNVLRRTESHAEGVLDTGAGSYYVTAAPDCSWELRTLTADDKP